MASALLINCDWRGHGPPRFSSCLSTLVSSCSKHEVRAVPRSQILGAAMSPEGRVLGKAVGGDNLLMSAERFRCDCPSKSASGNRVVIALRESMRWRFRERAQAQTLIQSEHGGCATGITRAPRTLDPRGLLNKELNGRFCAPPTHYAPPHHPSYVQTCIYRARLAFVIRLCRVNDLCRRKI